MSYCCDSANVIHVSKSGDDANGGIAQQYPVSLADDAKLTIAGAIAVASNGDTIIVWPGEYDEQVDLSGKTAVTLSGSGWGSKIVNTQAAAGVLLLGDYCKISNIWVENDYGVTSVDGYNGIVGAAKAGVRIENSYVKANGDVIKLSECDGSFIKNCIIVGGEYGIALVNTAVAKKTIIENCHINVDLWVKCNSAAIYVSGGRTIIRNCTAYADMTSSNASHQVIGLYINGISISTFVEVFNSIFYATSDSGTYQYGLYSLGAYAKVLAHTSIIQAAGSGDDDYSIINNPTLVSDIKISKCSYGTTSGVITRLDAALDANARVDIGAIGGAAQSLTDLKDFVDNGYDPSTHYIKDVATVKDILEGDEAIDTDATPFQRVVTNKTTAAELIRKDLKDIDGNSISNINTVIGSMEEPA